MVANLVYARDRSPTASTTRHDSTLNPCELIRFDLRCRSWTCNPPGILTLPSTAAVDAWFRTWWRSATRNGGRFPGIPEGGCQMPPIQDSRGGRRCVIRTKDSRNGHFHRAGDLRLRVYVSAVAAIGRHSRGRNFNRWFCDPFPPTWDTAPSHLLHAVKTEVFVCFTLSA